MGCDTHVTVFGNKVEMVQDREFMRHVHVTVFRNQDMEMVYAFSSSSLRN